jgi:biotin-dependent carboxylase-like uncharacterized protein
MPTSVEIMTPGLQATVQDGGRYGCARWGVAAGGAADMASYELSNRLVGNPPGAAVIEVAVGGLRARFPDGAIIAVTGAPTTARIDGVEASLNAALRVRPGSELSLSYASVGRSIYFAVRGGIDAPVHLGSRSTDTLGGVGPPQVAAGQSLLVGPADESEPPWFDVVPVRVPLAPFVIGVLPGPRADWLDGGAAALLSRSWSVGEACDRVGARLQGSPLVRRPEQQRVELPSEPMVYGAVQVPADGLPIVLGPDGGVTGGYPVVAVVVRDDLPMLGQLRPGDSVSFGLGHAPAHR